MSGENPSPLSTIEVGGDLFLFAPYFWPCPVRGQGSTYLADRACAERSFNAFYWELGWYPAYWALPTSMLKKYGVGSVCNLCTENHVYPEDTPPEKMVRVSRRAFEIGMPIREFVDWKVDEYLKTMREMPPRTVWWVTHGEYGGDLHHTRRMGWPGYGDGWQTKGDARRWFDEAMRKRDFFRFVRMVGNQVEFEGDPLRLTVPAFDEYVKERGLDPDEIQWSEFTARLTDPQLRYAWGAPMVLMERGCGLGSTQIGIACLRGAARQYGRQWGIYMSLGGGCFFDSDLEEVWSGHSADLLHRTWLVSYLSGTNMLVPEYGFGSWWRDEDLLVNEPKDNFEQLALAMPGSDWHHRTYTSTAVYTDPKASPLRRTPAGDRAKLFGDFALWRHRDRGRPVIPIGLVMDQNHGWGSGFFGDYRRGEFKTWGEFPFTPGDHMLDNIFEVIFPGHSRHFEGETVPNKRDPSWQPMTYAPAKGWTDDLKRHEKRDLTQARYGDSFDAVYTNCPGEILKEFEVLIPIGDIQADEELLRRWLDYAWQGGTLILNTQYLTGAGAGILDGVHVLNETGLGKKVLGRFGARDSFDEPAAFLYDRIRIMAGREALLEAENGEALAVELPTGRGRVVLTTVHYMQFFEAERLVSIPGFADFKRPFTGILNSMVSLVDHILLPLLPLAVTGTPLEWIVSENEEGRIVLVLNNNLDSWKGKITVRPFGRPIVSVRDLYTEEPVNHHETRDGTTIDLDLPPFGFRVLGVGNFRPKTLDPEVQELLTRYYN